MYQQHWSSFPITHDVFEAVYKFSNITRLLDVNRSLPGSAAHFHYAGRAECGEDHRGKPRHDLISLQVAETESYPSRTTRAPRNARLEFPYPNRYERSWAYVDVLLWN